MKVEKIYLAPPNVSEEEKKLLVEALESGWVAPVGPMLAQFEEEVAHYFNGKRVLMVNSGTAALHLSLLCLGVGKGDEVLTSSMTFGACASVIRYQRATPVFIDSEEQTWNMDPNVLEAYLASVKTKPKAVILTHLYGYAAKLNEIRSILQQHEIPLIEDAAEAMGSSYQERALGGFGEFGVISFNGNKIMTTSGGGALICNDESYDRALHLATQANAGLYSYEYDQVGYNYRMSNILAGLGLAQLKKLYLFMKRKEEVYQRYQEELGDVMEFPQQVEHGVNNYWLTTALLKVKRDPLSLIEWLAQNNIESRRLWKPLHLHPPYSRFHFIGDGLCERLYDIGICLPSGSGLSVKQQSRVIETVREFF